MKETISMFCAQCGTQASEGSGFCRNCGSAIANNNATQQASNENPVPNYQQPPSSDAVYPVNGQVRNPVVCILLTIITCGIYALYWDWVTKDQINSLADRETIGAGMLILGWFCFPVLFYVWYKWDEGLQDIAQKFNVRYSSNFVLWIILAFLTGVGRLVLMFQIQDTLNKIYGEG